MDENVENVVNEARRAARLKSSIDKKYHNKGISRTLYEELFEGGDETFIRRTIVASIGFGVGDQEAVHRMADEGARLVEGKQAKDAKQAKADLIQSKATLMHVWLHIREYIRREDPKVLALIRSRTEDES